MREKIQTFFGKRTKEVRLFDVAVVPAMIVAFGPLVLLAVVAIWIIVLVIRTIIRIAQEKREKTKAQDKEERT